MSEIEGRVALVTGGGRGQGRAHAVALAEAGAAVVVCDAPGRIDSVPYALSTAADLAETVRLVQDRGGRALAVEADVRSGDQMAAAVAEAVDAFGAVDILIANAGICVSGGVAELSDQEWSDTIDTNLTGVFNSMRAVLPSMIERRWGRIVATASMAGRGGTPNLAHYSAAKFGVIGLVKSVALEVARLGVTVHAICPTTVNTPMIHHEANYRLFCPDLVEPTRDDVIERFARMNPLHVPWLEPEAVAREVVHLVTGGAVATGSVIELGLGASEETVALVRASTRARIQFVAETVQNGPPAPDSLIPSQRARRERIIAAALRLLEYGEYDKIQMRDIAEEADVALGTVYRYFASKEHLFAAVLVKWSESLQSRVQRRPLTGDSPERMLNDLMGRVLTAFERFPQFHRLIVVLESTPDPYARALHAQFAGQTGSTFLEPLVALDPAVADDIIDVVKAVLWAVLRSWNQGAITMKEARRRMARSIQLIFAPPPTVAASNGS